MYDLIVIGAGLAGSGLAAAVARRGHRVLLVERRSLPQHRVCGEFLSPESQGSLAALGLDAAVARLAPATMASARLVASGGAALDVPLPGAALGVSRYALDAALAEGARQAGAVVRLGVAASGVTRTPGGRTVALRAGPRQHETVTARAVVVAAGRHPGPALRAEAERTPDRSGVGVKAHYRGLPMPPQVELYLFDGGYAGLGPVEGGRTNLCIYAERAAFRRAGGSSPALIEAAATWNPQLAARLAGAELLPETLCAVAPVDTERRAVPWADGARLGDAATMIPPLCGDGMAMALRAAELCAPQADAFLRGRLDEAGWEAAYVAAWRREFAPRLRTARLLQRLLLSAPLASIALPLGGALPWAAGHLVRATRGA